VRYLFSFLLFLFFYGITSNSVLCLESTNIQKNYNFSTVVILDPYNPNYNLSNEAIEDRDFENTLKDFIGIDNSDVFLNVFEVSPNEQAKPDTKYFHIDFKKYKKNSNNYKLVSIDKLENKEKENLNIIMKLVLLTEIENKEKFVQFIEKKQISNTSEMVKELNFRHSLRFGSLKEAYDALAQLPDEYILRKYLSYEDFHLPVRIEIQFSDALIGIKKNKMLDLLKRTQEIDKTINNADSFRGLLDLRSIKNSIFQKGRKPKFMKELKIKYIKKLSYLLKKENISDKKMISAYFKKLAEMQDYPKNHHTYYGSYDIDELAQPNPEVEHINLVNVLKSLHSDVKVSSMDGSPITLYYHSDAEFVEYWLQSQFMDSGSIKVMVDNKVDSSKSFTFNDYLSCIILNEPNFLPEPNSETNDYNNVICFIKEKNWNPFLYFSYPDPNPWKDSF